MCNFSVSQFFFRETEVSWIVSLEDRHKITGNGKYC